ncbi:hypothetical protein B296_00059231 [Ensete ventricosum]|uniref:Uncharacterized protein n=1 Tax=Ensete ventricosum TaxID=4639 RepID=A0A426X234_ENSVE|nr:hypothetical protein B296_00059231 [Ensete ventricosum]
MHRVDAFGNSPGVCQKLAVGTGSLPGWRHKGVRQKKIKTCQKIIGGSRKACRYSDDAVRFRWKFARRFVEGSGSSLGTRREIAIKKTRGLTARLPEVAGICGS